MSCKLIRTAPQRAQLFPPFAAASHADPLRSSRSPVVPGIFGNKEKESCAPNHVAKKGVAPSDADIAHSRLILAGSRGPWGFAPQHQCRRCSSSVTVSNGGTE